MALTTCRECGGKVSSEALTCPHCGVGQPAQDGEATEDERSLKDKTLLAGWICFGLGMVTMIFTFPLPVISAPLFLASFVIAIVVIVRGRVGAGIGLLLSNIVIPAVVFFGVIYLGLTSWADEQEEAVPASEAVAQLRVEGVNARRSGGSMYCSGTVRNAGSKPVKTLLIITEWLDRSGDVVASGRMMPMGALGLLRPGESTDFEDRFTDKPAMTDCRVEVFVD